MISKFIDWTERGYMPDTLVRVGIRRLLKKRLAAVDQGSLSANRTRLDSLIEEFSNGPLALVPEKANEQHYEVPAELFVNTLGERLKYSGCYWSDGVKDLNQAEEVALAKSCEHAELADGMDVLELGCGWGSLSLWMAEHYPSANITSVSNSASQREFILERAKQRGLDANLNVITCDINDFRCEQKFDRVVSIEMFEHIRNHRELFRRIAGWLKDDGKLFAHIFCHREWTYKFHDEGSSDWMSRYFFSGGIMPGNDLFSEYQDDLRLQDQWKWDGTHYQRTCEAWLQNMDRNRNGIMPLLQATYGENQATRWFNRWRMFYLACSELFGYRDGEEWWVSHYLFEKIKISDN